jgi:hypothetical protein
MVFPIRKESWEKSIKQLFFEANFKGADIHISPDGKFLYAQTVGKRIRFQPLEF